MRAKMKTMIGLTLAALVLGVLVGCTCKDHQFKRYLVLDQQMIDNDWRYATNNVGL